MATKLKKTIFNLRVAQIITIPLIIIFSVIISSEINALNHDYQPYYFHSNEFLEITNDFVSDILIEIETQEQSDTLKDTTMFYYNISGKDAENSKKFSYSNIDLIEIRKIVQKNEHALSYIVDYPNDDFNYNLIYYADNVYLDEIQTELRDNQDVSIYIVVNPNFVEQKDAENISQQEQYSQMAEQTVSDMMILLIFIIILVIYLTIATWMSAEMVENSWLDKWYTEIQIITILSAIPLYFELSINNASDMRFVEIVYFASGCLMLIGLVQYLSLVRKLKKKTFISQSFLAKNFLSISRHIETLIDKRADNYTEKLRSYTWLLNIMIAISFLLIFFGFMLYDAIALTFFGVLLLVGTLILYYHQTQKLVIDIDSEVKRSVEEQMKAEKMKIELVTNVSHDLKTPLTSLISYIDLLADEKLKDVQKEYVDILKNKAQTLSTIINDLFDLAKATSGNIDVQLEPLNLTNLVDQTLIDFEDSLKKAKMKVKVDMIPEANILSDGTRLHRSIANLIENAIKYSIKKTRIFIKLVEADNKYILTIQNTANYEMDFAETEIVERFVRADKARTTEGSGLGLSIAKSFIEISGGDFAIHIDGDQFKVTLTFNKIK